MALNSDRFLQTQSDGYITVRDLDGRLLGCIPGAPPAEDFLQTPIGSVPVYAAIVFCAVPDKSQFPRLREWPGFIPASGDADLAVPIGTDESAYTKGDEP